MKRQPCIYKITNIKDGKVYIGQTTVNFEYRINKHLFELKNNIHKNTHLQNAWNKYGEENFKFEVLQECGLEEIDELERFWIALYDSTNRNYGYNFENGGNKNKRIHKETLKKLSEKSKRNWRDPQYLKKMKIRSDKMKGSNNPLAVKIICINDGKVFDSMMDAANYYQISNKSICSVCKGKKISTHGLQFAYYEDGKEYKLKEVPKYKKGNHHSARKIICINDNKIFDSIVEASEYYQINYGNIYQVVTGKSTATESYDGRWLQFSYYEDGKVYELKKIDKNKIKKPKKVICITTGEIFESTRDAAKKMGTNQSKISLACNGKRNYAGKLPDGTKLRWAFVN